MSNSTEGPSNIESNVPGEQQLRKDVNTETSNEKDIIEVKEEFTLSPVITVTKNEAAFTKGDLKLQKVTVTEDISNDSKSNEAIRIMESTSELGENSHNNNEISEERVGFKKVSKIPKLSFRQAADNVKDGKIRDNETGQVINNPKPKSGIPRFKDGKLSPLKPASDLNTAIKSANNIDTSTKPANDVNIAIKPAKDVNTVIKPANDVCVAIKPANDVCVAIKPANDVNGSDKVVNDSLTEEEFDKIYEEIVETEASNNNAILDEINDAEILESKFEEIIHAYDEEKLESVKTEKVKSKIPLLKRRSEPDIKPLKQIDRRSSLQRNIVGKIPVINSNKERITKNETKSCFSQINSQTSNLTSSKWTTLSNRLLESSQSHEVTKNVTTTINSVTEENSLTRHYEETTNEELKDRNTIFTSLETKETETVFGSLDSNEQRATTEIYQKEDISNLDPKIISIEADTFNSFEDLKTDDLQSFEDLETIIENECIDIPIISVSSVSETILDDSRHDAQRASIIIDSESIENDNHILAPEDERTNIITDKNESLLKIDSCEVTLTEVESVEVVPIDNSALHTIKYNERIYERLCGNQPHVNSDNLDLNHNDIIETQQIEIAIENLIDKASENEAILLNSTNEKDNKSQNTFDSENPFKFESVKYTHEQIEKSRSKDFVRTSEIKTKFKDESMSGTNKHKYELLKCDTHVNTIESIMKKKLSSKIKNIEDLEEEDIIILKGKVNRIISRLDSREPKINRTEGDDIPKNISVLSKIALFEKSEPKHINQRPLNKLHRCQFTKDDKPRIVDEVLKAPDKNKHSLDHSFVETETSKINTSCNASKLPINSNTSTTTTNILKEDLAHNGSNFKSKYEQNFKYDDHTISKVTNIIGSKESKIDRNKLISMLDNRDETKVIPALNNESKTVIDNKIVIDNQTVTDNAETHKTKDKINDVEIIETHEVFFTIKDNEKPQKKTDEIYNTYKTKRFDRYKDVDMRRAKSAAELDLGDAVSGKVKQMVVRMKSVDKLEVGRKEVIDVREKPRRGSVSERIALFEKRLAAIPMEEIVAATPSPVIPTELPDLLDNQIAQLTNAKFDFGTFENMTYVNLFEGGAIPALVFGTALLDPRLIHHIIGAAIDLGYRAFDTAFIYGNEVAVGEAIRAKIREGTVRREDLFIISKLWSSFHRRDLVERACRDSLTAMGLDYFDLYLIHNPISLKEGSHPLPKIANVLQFSEHDYLDAWFGVEDVIKKGLAKRGGVSNFNSVQIEKIIEKGKFRPAVNQVESHPYLTQQRLSEFCNSRNVTLMSFGALGSKGTPKEYKSDLPPVIDEPLVKVMAAGLGITPAQLLLSHQMHMGRSVVVKGSSPGHMWDNLLAIDVHLEPEHIAALNALNKNKRTFTLEGFGETHKNYPFKIPY